MIITKPNPKVLVVAPALIIELLCLAIFAEQNGQHKLAKNMLYALRQLRPDISEISAYLALCLINEGLLSEALEVLETYTESGFQENSLILSIMANMRYQRGDPDWSGVALKAQQMVQLDGGGGVQTQMLEALPR